MPQLIDPLVMATPGNAIHPMLQLTRIVGATIVWCMLAHEINLALRQHTHTHQSSPAFPPTSLSQSFDGKCSFCRRDYGRFSCQIRHITPGIFACYCNSRSDIMPKGAQPLAWTGCGQRERQKREREREKTIRERSVCIHTHTLKERSQSESVILNKPTHTDPMPRYVGQLLASIANSSR